MKKILFVTNKIIWTSLPQKIKEIQSFFYPTVNLQIDVRQTAFTSIPVVPEQIISAIPGSPQICNAYLIDDSWYFQNVDALAINYDAVVFMVSPSDLLPKTNLIPAGVTTASHNGIGQITIFVPDGSENWHAYQNGIDRGSDFAFITCHEISHWLYQELSLPDNTHLYFYSTNPQGVLNDLCKGLQTVSNAPTTKPDTNTLARFCIAIQAYEGYYVGSRSYRNCNPGNIRFTTLTQELGAIGKDDKDFAIFPSYQVGFTALKSMIAIFASGSSSYYRPSMTLPQFFAVYAPSSDNNSPDVYAQFIAKQLGVDITTFTLQDVIA